MKVVVAALAALAHAQDISLVGVPPNLQDQVKANVVDGSSWKCLDGSSTIPISALNDDFCDCKDGSDEFGSAACSTVSLDGGRFYCDNFPSRPRYLYSSRVHDLICDCCDGSDERPGLCPNTCETEGQALIEARALAVNSVTDGLNAKDELLRQGGAKREQWKLDIAHNEAQTPVLEGKKSALEPKQQARKANLDAAKAEYTKYDHSSLPDMFGDDRTEPEDEAEGSVRAKTDAAVEKVEKKVVSEYAKWADNADEAHEEEEDDAGEEYVEPIMEQG